MFHFWHHATINGAKLVVDIIKILLYTRTEVGKKCYLKCTASSLQRFLMNCCVLGKLGQYHVYSSL